MMSMLSCPLCGRLVSLRIFAPEELVEDVQVVYRKSLGRGKGFAVVGRESALDDTELMKRIANRLHLLMGLIEGEDDIRDVRIESLEQEVEGLKDYNKELQGELNEYEALLATSEETNEELEALEAAVENALRLLNDHLGGSFTDLEAAIEAIIG